MNERAWKRIFSADVMGLFLIYMALQVLLYGVEAFLRGVQADNLFWICLIAALLALWLGKSKWNGILASALMAALGIAGIWILSARLGSPLLELLRSIAAIRPQFFPEFMYRFDVDGSGIASSWNAIGLASSVLLERWQTWFMGIGRNVNVNDALISNMLWTFALWLLSAWIGWFAARRNAVASLLPGAGLLTLLMYNNERRAEMLWALVVIMLLLMGIWHYKKLTAQWTSLGIDYSDSVRYDNGQAVLMVVLVVGTLAFLTPSISWQDIRDAWREIERQRAAQSSNAKATPGSGQAQPPKPKPTVRAELPREHLLTAGAAQSETIVMTIKTGELPPVVIQNFTTNAPRYYWRSAIYDQYGGAGWYTSSAPPQSIEANQPLIVGVLSGYKLLHLQVNMQQPEGTLFWSGMLYSANIPIKVDWRLRPQSNLFADQTALLQADMFAVHTDASTFNVDTYIPTPSVEQLRAASTEYPNHIRDVYFSLPNTVPERVHELAQEITRGKETPYDKAKAIETYLRTNYPYDLEIGAPPEGQDVADYFLFDLKRGYCDYYATAMVVLARSSRLPARFVSGYAPGEYDAPNAQYIIRELHAHSWAEVYFPEIGWVEFEPTGHEPEIVREEAKPDTASDEQTGKVTRKILFELTGQRWSVLLIPVAAVIFAILLYFSVIERMLFLRLAPPVAVEILYKRLYRSGRTLAGEHTQAETAHEFMDKLIQCMLHIHEQLKFKGSPRNVRSDVEQLTRIYQSSLFSHEGVDQQDARLALNTWTRLRWSLLIERTKYFLWMKIIVRYSK